MVSSKMLGDRQWFLAQSMEKSGERHILFAQEYA